MELFICVSLALIGGIVAKKLKFQPIIGYILAGIIANAIFPVKSLGIEKLSELGAILLLFSLGLEFSPAKFKGVFNKILGASILQMIIVSILLFFILKIFKIDNLSSLILAVGFSLSSTAVIIKILFDKGESETMHGKLMIAWLLIQDLAVIPIMILLPLLSGSKEILFVTGLIAILKAVVLVSLSVILGRILVPYLIHKVASYNSRELLLLTSVFLAVGTAIGASFFGISTALGAFIAGFVISESQENHAIFAETRPLKNLFVALFFVTLGFFVSPDIIVSNFAKLILISLIVIIIKFITIISINYFFKFNGKTMVLTSVGLSQVGEFAFIIFSTASVLGLISKETSSMGIAVGLITLIISPLLYANSMKLWRALKNKFNIFSSVDRIKNSAEILKDHIIILGYGRVGGWVGKALVDNGINFVVIDYDQGVVTDCRSKGINAIYGDPAEKEVLEMANLSLAKAVIVAIPDRLSQESIIAHVQTLAPNTKIISRVHLDEDWEKMKLLRVDKLIQPEFEAATSIIKSILVSMGKDREFINKSIKSIRLSHAKI